LIVAGVVAPDRFQFHVQYSPLVFGKCMAKVAGERRLSL